MEILKNKRSKVNLHLNLLENYLLVTGKENQVKVAKEKLEYIISGRDGKLLSAAKIDFAKLDRFCRDGTRQRPPPATAPSAGTTDSNHQSFKCSSRVGFLGI